MSQNAFSESALKILQTAAQAVADAASAVKTAAEAVATSAEALKAAAVAVQAPQQALAAAPASAPQNSSAPSPLSADAEEIPEEELVALLAAAAADVLGVHVSQIQVVDVHEDHSWRMQGRNAIHHSHRLR